LLDVALGLGFGVRGAAGREHEDRGEAVRDPSLRSG
jgi:hypothetical protein